MKIISDKYLNQYKAQLQIDLDNALSEVNKIELTPRSFTFYTSVAVIASFRIEGEQMEIDSYLNHKMQHIEYLPELVEKPDDLFQAYLLQKTINSPGKISCKPMSCFQHTCCPKNGGALTGEMKCW